MCLLEAYGRVGVVCFTCLEVVMSLSKSHMAKSVVSVSFVIVLTCSGAIAQNYPLANPYELTSRGVISEQSKQYYESALKSCYPGKPGSSPKGPEFLACLKKQTRIQDAQLNELYNSTLSQLRPEPANRLRQSQLSWKKFRDLNCVFAQSAAPRENADEFLYDCILKITTERIAELRSLVGD
jgi:uncharacterized protein YecT (DUF1311 family)